MRNFFGVVLLLAGTIVFANIVQSSNHPSEAIWWLLVVPVAGVLYPWKM